MPRKAFLLRIDEQLLNALQRWADSDLRSLNGQIEYLLREALQKHGGAPPKSDSENQSPPDNEKS
jgi:hypothetical protein